MFFIIILMAAVQGLTEFLPVSSSGHLSIIHIFCKKLPSDSLLLEVSLHIGTLISVLIYYRKKIIKLLQNKNSSFSLVTVLIAVFPPVIAGVLIRSLIIKQSTSIYFVALFLFITGLVLFSCKNINTINNKSKISSKEALIIGFFQIFALFPGISRSGITIATALHLKISKEEAADFSFIMAIPLIAGAFVFELATNNNSVDSISFDLLSTGIVFSAIFGLIAIYIVNSMLKKQVFYNFCWYCFLLSLSLFSAGFYLIN